MEQLIPLLTNMVTGAVGGNVAGSALKDKSLGFTGNSITGVIGSLIVSLLAGTELAGVVSALGLTGMTGDLASSGAGGAVAMAVFAYLKPYLMPYVAQYLPGFSSSAVTPTTSTHTE